MLSSWARGRPPREPISRVALRLGAHNASARGKPMHRRIRGVLALLAAAVVGSCTGDSSSGTRSFVPTAPNRVTSGFPDIDLQIATLFPTGLETAAGVQWRNVTTKLSAGDHVTAEKMFWDLVDWTLKKSGRLIDPSGPVTSLQALNQLV